MTTLKDIYLTEDQQRVLSSVMEGGPNWTRYTEENGDCLKNCPFYTQCSGWGPQDVCSSQCWEAETTPDVLDVVFHVINNFDYYNREDTSNTGNDEVLSDARRLIHDFRSRLAEEEFEEGAHIIRQHRYRERNSSAAKKKKDEAVANGHLTCESCGIDYFAMYGERGRRLMDCHHTIPLSSDAHRGVTKMADLILLCANCHRLAHSEPAPIPLPALQSLVTGNNR